MVIDWVKFPCRVVVAPSDDLRQRFIIEVKSEEQVLRLQKMRFEIIEYLDQKEVSESE